LGPELKRAAAHNVGQAAVAVVSAELRSHRHGGGHDGDGRLGAGTVLDTAVEVAVGLQDASAAGGVVGDPDALKAADSGAAGVVQVRSEERRVGKEGRSGRGRAAGRTAEERGLKRNASSAGVAVGA